MAKKSSVKIPAIAIIRCIVFLFIFVILFWIYSRVADFLNNDPMFNIKNVTVEQSISFIDLRPLRNLIGQNIFDVDLLKLHRQISYEYPQISQLRIERQLPDTIKVLAKKRDVLLQVAVKTRYLIVDTEGVTMFYVNQPLPFPTVRGISLEKSKLVLGTVSSIKELNLVVDLLNQLKSHSHTSRLKILSIDAANVSKVQFVVMPNIQIIIDQDDLAAKVNMLDILLQNGKVNWAQVKYIDIRFKEPIINTT